VVPLQTPACVPIAPATASFMALKIELCQAFNPVNCVINFLNNHGFNAHFVCNMFQLVCVASAGRWPIAVEC